MPEVMTPPLKIADHDSGEVSVMFSPEHTLSDIARWLLENRVDAEEVFHMLAKELLSPVAYAALLASLEQETKT